MEGELKQYVGLCLGSKGRNQMRCERTVAGEHAEDVLRFSASPSPSGSTCERMAEAERGVETNDGLQYAQSGYVAGLHGGGVHVTVILHVQLKDISFSISLISSLELSHVVVVVALHPQVEEGQALP
ncbi:Hypothetical predicted protein [Prunus dulcis]|uniref:Uncharacterized protein n=1 Tax=Prunus dulcis TaxID=3755 RepID=A0A5E4G851_PRUDU|nr:Hypothetical predicted protein [Prunus dulcis]